MEQLAEHGLRFGRLIDVTSKTMRGRYNQALERLVGRTTKLRTFNIDLSGFSPEVAEELGDPLYLNPHGVNKKFILLSTQQEALASLDTQFTSSPTILRRFIADNRKQLFALSTRDVIFGELQNSTFRIDSVDDLLSIRQIRVEVRTTKDVIVKAEALRALMERFRRDEEAWHDDEMLAEIVELAEVTGDIRRHPVIPRDTQYAQPNYFASHFGGVYVFLDTRPATVISVDPDFATRLDGNRTKLEHISMTDKAAVARFLADRRLIEFIGDGGVIDPVELLQEKAAFAAYDTLAGLGAFKDGVIAKGEALKRLIYEHYDDLPDDFRTLTKAVKQLEHDPNAGIADLPGDAYFYLVRASDHADRDLVNHLIAHYAPYDFRHSYICNRTLFEQQFESWDEAKKNLVADYLGRSYAGREAEVEHELYGRHPSGWGPWGPRKGGTAA